MDQNCQWFDCLYNLTRPGLLIVYFVLSLLYIMLSFVSTESIKKGRNGAIRAMRINFIASFFIFMSISLLQIIAYARSDSYISFLVNNYPIHVITLMIILISGIFVIYSLYKIRDALLKERITISLEEDE